MLNGPPGAGKSTLARRYLGDHPLALRIDVDEVREWHRPTGGTRPTRPGSRPDRSPSPWPRRTSTGGHDVVVAQLYGRIDPLVELDGWPAECSAEFCEIGLMVGLDDTVARFVERGGPRLDDVLASPAGLDTVRELHARVERVLVERPGAVVVEPVWGDPDATYELVTAAIEMRVRRDAIARVDRPVRRSGIPWPSVHVRAASALAATPLTAVVAWRDATGSTTRATAAGTAPRPAASTCRRGRRRRSTGLRLGPSRVGRPVRQLDAAAGWRPAAGDGRPGRHGRHLPAAAAGPGAGGAARPRSARRCRRDPGRVLRTRRRSMTWPTRSSSTAGATGTPSTRAPTRCVSDDNAVVALAALQAHAQLVPPSPTASGCTGPSAPSRW